MKGYITDILKYFVFVCADRDRITEDDVIGTSFIEVSTISSPGDQGINIITCLFIAVQFVFNQSFPFSNSSLIL